MSQRLNDYLAQEASEYLDQMSALLTGHRSVDPEQLLRLARGVRGSAQMAGAETLAGVAERLEDAARSVVSRHVVWSEEIRQLTLQTVGDLQVLLRALNRWGPAEEARVRTAIERFDDLEAQEGSRGDASAGVVPISALFYDDEGPHIVGGATAPSPPAPPAPAQQADGDAVAIETLLFRGDAALQAALALRPRVEELLRDPGQGSELLDELFDLIRLGQRDAAAG